MAQSIRRTRGKVTEYLGDTEDLIAAIRGTSKPIALVIGSALCTNPSDPLHGVPNATGMVDIIREAVIQRGLNVSKFENRVDGKRGAEAYQLGMAFLQATASQDEVNNVIRRAVLRAHKNPTSVILSDITSDFKPQDWILPPAIEVLGHWLVSQPPGGIGPVLTTNFDPFIELAVKVHRGSFRVSVLDADGRLERDVEFQEGVLNIVHMHGYWRGGDTLHTPRQLTAPRPFLNASLQRLLSRHMVVVAGYGGWDDAFMSALEDLAQDDQANIDIRWAFHESDSALLQVSYAHVFGKAQSAVLRGRFVPYGGVDCYELFSDLLSEDSSPSTTVSETEALLNGWVVANSHFIQAHQETLSSDELRNYYDGQVPTWRHALSHAIPRREVVRQTVDTLTEKSSPGSSNSLHLLLGAGGEGKSTALLQVAAEIARRSDNWTILWRPTADTVLNPAQVADLPGDSGPVLLVSDHGDTIVNDLYQSAELLHAIGKTNVHFLVSARDTDWHFVGGERKGWSLILEYPGPVLMRGISHGDAIEIVKAWGEPSVNALGQLSELDNDRARARALEDATKAESLRREGSFFGGLLRARFSTAALRAHVREMIGRLSDRQVGFQGKTLGDAFLYVAACHAVVGPLDRRILADLVGVPFEQVGSSLERPLGEEAASVRAGLSMTTRHSAVAEAAIEVAHQQLGVSLPELYAEIVKQTISTRKRLDLMPQEYGALVHCAPRLVHRLPPAIGRDVLQRTAVAAAQAATSLLPDDLSVAIDYATALRRAREPRLGLEVLQRHWARADQAEDWNKNSRRFVCEWGRIYQNLRDRAAHIWMDLASVSDFLNPASIRSHDIDYVCTDLTRAFRELTEGRSGWPGGIDYSPFARATDSIAWIQNELAVSKSLNESESEWPGTDDGYGSAGPGIQAEDAMYTLFEAGQAAVQLIRTPSVPFADDSGNLSFEYLRASIESRR